MPPVVFDSHGLDVALFEPEIPPNAGNVARLCAATGTRLHLVGRLGFSFRHPSVRRSGMDYWERVQLHRHLSFDDFASAVAGRRLWAFSTRAARTLWETEFEPGDVLLFGPESRGLPDAILDAGNSLPIRIPMVTGERSLNLASAVAVGLYEALRQISEGTPDG